MDVLAVLKEAISKGEIIPFLRGEGEYMCEHNEMVQAPEQTDVSKVLSRGIYKLYKEDNSIKVLFENGLLEMLDGDDFDVYMVGAYLTSILFKEQNGLAPFSLDKDKIIDRFSEEVLSRKDRIKAGVKHASGFVNASAWEDIERFNYVCKTNYNVQLF
ncbi:hypothetical protein SAMN02910298_01747 [Pseudobutyrivibrio sp. YE44]|uniref:hypothetical protein n=1 Tax=Pseudobutyrivibrio sp. YE44 TaxID=1520802 RepID=UPI00089098CD|nr:hypothetical protein [Pseudobutyrivibrio sp. YE44]SDB35432.1 hypothetical protein SAMN02910298_01747 [Pseudobutyrivibrio sp. YE44]